LFITGIVELRTQDNLQSVPPTQAGRSSLRVQYLSAADYARRSHGAPLALVHFGTERPPNTDGSLLIHVSLEPLSGPRLTECWLGEGAVTQGRSGSIRFAHDDRFLFAVLEEDERRHAGIRETTHASYRAIRDFQRTSGFPHLLRMWNYLDAVNEGEDDLERYRQFCVGRATGLSDSATADYPAATAIGRQIKTHELQVFWIAARVPGSAIENPRQVSAYRYPRVHGPVSPSFSRATVSADGMLLISGTASIVGHASQHIGDPAAQLDETLRNLDALLQRVDGKQVQPDNSILKVYVRDPAQLAVLSKRLQQRFPNVPVTYLAADICRRELLLEIECVVGS
jgi:chorismate lyase/3-hydroxybenzoate synthase